MNKVSVLLFNRGMTHVTVNHGESVETERRARDTAARLSMVPADKLTMFAEVIDIAAKERHVLFFFVAEDLDVLMGGRSVEEIVTEPVMRWAVPLATGWAVEDLGMVTAMRRMKK